MSLEPRTNGPIRPRAWRVAFGGLLLFLLLAGCMPDTGTNTESPQVEQAEEVPATATVAVPAEETTDASQAGSEEATATGETEGAIPLLPTVTNSPIPVVEPSPEPVDWTQVATVEGNYFVLGNPDASVRLIDYSDFL